MVNNKEENDKLIELFSSFIKENNESNLQFAVKNSLSDAYAGRVLIEVESGGVRGGSCYDEGEHDLEDYYVDDHTQMEELARNIQNEFAYVLNTVGFSLDLKNTSYKVTRDAACIKQYTQHEYYGNSINYLVYAVDMADVFKATLDSPTYALFQKATVSLMEEPLNSELKARREEIVEQLQDFDKENNKQKEALKARIDKLQKVYDNFDGNVSELRKDLEQELGDIDSKINPQRKKNKP